MGSSLFWEHQNGAGRSLTLARSRLGFNKALDAHPVSILRNGTINPFGGSILPVHRSPAIA